jgi:hypothetical protein
MKQLTCLSLLCFAACTAVPDEQPTLLIDMPHRGVLFAANPTRTFVEVQPMFYDRASGESCVVLHESFRATVGDAELPVSHPGSVSDGGEDECRGPTVGLAFPPPAQTITLADDSLQIVIDVGGRLARLRPESPLIVEVGATVTVPYAPASTNLLDGNMTLVLVHPGGSSDGSGVQLSASSGTLTFVVPDHPGSGQLELRSLERGGPKPYPCTGASCLIVGTSAQPALTTPIEIRRPATM